MLNLLAQILPFAFVVKIEELSSVLLTTIIFVAIGLVVFGIAFLIIVMVAPFSVKKEIEEDQNTSLAILIGSMIIGMAIIIAAAISGS